MMMQVAFVVYCMKNVFFVKHFMWKVEICHALLHFWGGEWVVFSVKEGLKVGSLNKFNLFFHIVPYHHQVKRMLELLELHT